MKRKPFLFSIFLSLSIIFVASTSHAFSQIGDSQELYHKVNDGTHTLYFVAYFSEPAYIMNIAGFWDKYQKGFLIYKYKFTDPLIKEFDKDITCTIDQEKMYLVCETLVEDFFTDPEDDLKACLRFEKPNLSDPTKTDILYSESILLKDAKNGIPVFDTGETEDDPPDPTEQFCIDNPADPVCTGVTTSDAEPNAGTNDPAICGSDPISEGCDPDGDGVVGAADDCPLDAESYGSDGTTPVDGNPDGCSTRGAQNLSQPPENDFLNGDGGGCSMVLGGKIDASKAIPLFAFLCLCVIFFILKRRIV